MSGTHGPIEISPLPADGGVVKSSLTYRASPIEISPLPADGGVVKSSLTHDTGIGWRYGLHMGNNSGFSIS